MKRALFCALAGLTLTSGAYAVEERPSGEQEQTALAVTIYNSDLALIKDTRRVRLSGGENRLAWRDVSARIQPETALLRALDGKRLTLLEQNFDFDLLTPQSLLAKSVGDTVRVIKTQPLTGAETSEQATVLAANQGVVLRFIDRIETGVPGRLAFSQVPADLRDRPTLSMLFTGDQAGERDLELSYLSGGLGWKADYVAELAGGDDRLDLNGWVTLTNTSGTAYRNARLQLVAGDIHRVRPEMKALAMMRAAPMLADESAPMQEEALFEYHLYTLERLTTLLDKQTKQVALLSAQGVAVDKEYLLQGTGHYYQAQYGDLGRQLKPTVFLGFINQGEQLGMPLPKGIVRVYKKDAAGRAQFIGEDRIEHTAKNEKVRLRLGEVFDITADKKQTDYQKIATYGRNGGVIETAYQIEIRNAKTEEVTIKVVEPMPGDWQMTQESLPHSKETAHTAVWQVLVPAEGKTLLTWRVRVRY